MVWESWIVILIFVDKNQFRFIGKKFLFPIIVCIFGKFFVI